VDARIDSTHPVPRLSKIAPSFLQPTVGMELVMTEQICPRIPNREPCLIVQRANQQRCPVLVEASLLLGARWVDVLLPAQTLSQMQPLKGSSKAALQDTP
jgi:hypothetical protein